jgi:ubiquinone/menaquinone biosynthesis C-methylase UbiE
MGWPQAGILLQGKLWNIMIKNEKAWGKKLREEIAHYAKVEKVHDLPPIYHYWENKFLRPKMESLGFSGAEQLYVDYIKRVCARQNKTEYKILSVGAGNCDLEINIAKSLVKDDILNFSFTCLDINPNMLKRGKENADTSDLASKFYFINSDINGWEISNKYHVIIASHSLHHFVELEILFDKIYDALHEEGFFITNDMIGRNGHMLWPEALELVNEFWSSLEDKYKYNHQLKRFEPILENWDCSKSGFEGIRAQDILPLLVKKFKFELFLGFNNLISVFVGRSFGHNFDASNERDRTFIDHVAQLDDDYIEAEKIKPTQMIAILTKEQKMPIKTYKHLTPEFCLRLPDGDDGYIQDSAGITETKARGICNYSIANLLRRAVGHFRYLIRYPRNFLRGILP